MPNGEVVIAVSAAKDAGCSEEVVEDGDDGKIWRVGDVPFLRSGKGGGCGGGEERDVESGLKWNGKGLAEALAARDLLGVKWADSALART